MKKQGWLLAAIFVLCTGCASENRELEQATTLRSRLQQSDGCSFQAEITVDQGETLLSFTLDCTGSTDGDLSFSVVKPETITGIRGTVSRDGKDLVFTDTALHIPMPEEAPSPVTGPWIFLSTLMKGYVTSACNEEDLVRISARHTHQEDALHLDIWLNGDGLPVYADVLREGKRILSLEVRNFQIL